MIHFPVLHSINQARQAYHSSSSERVGHWLCHKGLSIISIPSNLIGAGVGITGMCLSACTLGALKVTIFILTFGQKGHISTGFMWFEQRTVASAKEIVYTAQEIAQDLKKVMGQIIFLAACVLWANANKNQPIPTPEPKREEKINPFDTLPVELIQEIFKHLDIGSIGKTSAVCRLFNETLDDPIVITHILEQTPLTVTFNKVKCLKTADLNRRPITDQQLLSITTSNPFLETVDLTLCRKLTSRGITQALTSLQGLKTLILTEIIQKEDLKALAESCSEIEKLCLSNLWIREEEISTLFQNLKKLKSLNLGSCFALKKESWKVITQYGSQLEELQLHTKMIGDLEMQEMSHLRNLRSLDLSACAIQSSIGKILKECPHLHTLRLNNCPQLNSETIRASISQFIRLTSLGLSNLDDETFYSILRTCSNLESFTVTRSKISLEGIEKQTFYLPKLQSLDLSGCTQIKAANLLKLLKACPNLKSLSLNRCTQFTDEELKILIPALQHIETLSLQECPLTSDSLVPLLHENDCLQNLLLSCQLTDEDMQQMAPYLRGLCSLTLETLKMTPAGLTSLSKYGTKIRDIYLSVNQSYFKEEDLSNFRKMLSRTRVAYVLRQN